MNRSRLLLLLFLLNCCTGFAQKILWQQTVGGNKEDKTISVRQTADGGFVSGGWSSSDISGDKTDSCRGNMDYWIVKFDAYGVVQWDKTYGGNFIDILNTIDQTSDGGYICGGISGSGVSGDKTEGIIGLNDIWIIKLDATGAIQWQNTIGGLMAEYIFSITQTADGGYICGASSSSNIYGDKTENTNGIAGFLGCET